MQIDLLKGITILVTRPKHQAPPLCQLLENYGAKPICLPVIQIEPIILSEASKQLISTIHSIDFAIFISPNAVKYGIAQLMAHSTLAKTVKLVTIGQASAKKVQQLLGRLPDISPTNNYNSESLLALDSLQKNKVNNKSIIIFRGLGGRELLANTLRQRGATVNYAEVYQRIQPQYSNCELAQLLGTFEHINIITITSSEGLYNLVALLTQADHHPSKQDSYHSYLEKLWQIPLVVVTEKMRDQAQALGFKNYILMAHKASNQALVDSILLFYRGLSTPK
ncbi:MAG: uroporphyrinogen-III synthase [Gammaproteobacteria bacterium]|nr:uroporphyrinogen-III synthase [Gammaproteobacteria bacterium]